MNEIETNLQRRGWIRDAEGNWSYPSRAKSKRVVSDIRAATVAEPECAAVLQCNESVAREAIYPGRVRISITSYVCGQIRDEDNICPKFFIDMLRHVGLIRDDAPGFIEIDRIKETRVSSRKEEGCEIVITPLCG